MYPSALSVDAATRLSRVMAALRRPWPVWWVSRAVALIVAGVVALIHRGNVYYDVTFYGQWAEATLDGTRIPYQDFAWEYPPAALPAMLTPSVATAGLPTWELVPYAVAWVLMLLALDAFVLRSLLQRVAGGLKHPAIVLWVLGLPLLGALSWSRFDLLPAAAALAVVVAAGARRHLQSGAFAGLGAAMKLWPALLAPIQRTRRQSIIATATASGVVGGFALVTLAVTGSTGFSQVLGYQSDRGLQVESLPALPLMWLHTLNVEGYSTEFAFGASEIVGPGAAQLAQLATVAYLLGLALVGLAHWRLMKVDAGRRGVALSAVMILLVSLVTNKVFSPQYVLWLIAVVVAAAVLDRETWKPYVIPVLSLAALTQLVFPTFYTDVLYGAWAGMLMMTVRDALVVWLLVSVGRRLWREVRTAGEREALIAEIDADVSADLDQPQR